MPVDNLLGSSSLILSDSRARLATLAPLLEVAKSKMHKALTSCPVLRASLRGVNDKRHATTTESYPASRCHPTEPSMWSQSTTDRSFKRPEYNLYATDPSPSWVPRPRERQIDDYGFHSKLVPESCNGYDLGILGRAPRFDATLYELHGAWSKRGRGHRHNKSPDARSLKSPCLDVSRYLSMPWSSYTC